MRGGGGVSEVCGTPGGDECEETLRKHHVSGETEESVTLTCTLAGTLLSQGPKLAVVRARPLHG